MRSYHLILILWWIPSVCFGQDVGDAGQKLEDLLPELSDHYNVEFSFLDEVIQGKTVTSVDYEKQPLKEILSLLSREARLKFEQIEEDYVSIRPFRNEDLVSLCGYISNFSNEPLIGVTVGYSRTQGSFTDVDGYFVLDSIPYGSRLTISYVGYMSKQFNVSNLSFSDCARIRLGESVNVLEEVIVSDYLAVGITKSKNEITINPAEFKTLPGLIEPDVMQSIQQIPGVNSPYETAAGLFVRGGLPDQNLVQWNGIKTYNQGHFFGMISAFNPYIVDKVSFTKGGTSARFGDRVSSVVDITSSSKVADSFSGGAGTNLLYGDAYLDIPLISNKLSIQLSGRRSFTDLVETITYNRIADRVFQNTKISESISGDQQTSNSFFFNDFTTKAIWDVNPNNKLVINTLYNKNDLDFRSFNVANNQSFNDLLLNANEGYSMEWNSQFSERLSFRLDGNYAKYLLRYDFISTVADTVTRSSKKNLVREAGGRLDGKYRIDSNHELVFGYHFSSNSIQYAYETSAPSYNIVLDQDDGTVNTHSFYSELDREVNGLAIRPGLRVNYYRELDEVALEPRLLVEKRLSEKVSLSTSGEYRTQVASQIKESVVSDLSLENKVWALASKDRFPVIRSYQFTLGGSFTHKGWLVDLEGYRKQVMDVTTLTFGFLNPTDNEFRLGESRIIGTDFLLKKQWLDYEAWTSYSFVRTENTFEGLNENQAFPGSWNIEHTVRLTGVANFNDWVFTLGWIWHTGKSFTDVIDNAQGGPVTVTFGSINSNNLPAYHRLDLSILKEFQAKKSSLRYRAGLSILNLYNRRNLLNREFRTTPSLDNELIDTKVYSLGFTPNLVFRIFW